MSLPSHGANPLRLYESFGLQAPKQIYDFSENVNPVGPPAMIQQNWAHYFQSIATYPDPHGEPFLGAVAQFHQVAKENIVLGNGASEIFAILARRYTGKRVLVVHPTFSEYEATLQMAGVEVVDVVVDDIATWQLPLERVKLEMQRAAAIYLCTPNNPTGVLLSRHVLEQLIAHGRTVNCEIVLDEAFIDWVDEQLSYIPTIVTGNSHVIVVRSMTKLYAIPGIRLGYVVAHQAIAQQLAAYMPHWHINSLAASIGVQCLNSVDYARQAVEQARVHREQIGQLLRTYGCQVSHSVTNYVAFCLPDVQQSDAFFRFCLQRGIVLRHSFNFKGMNGEWFRIGMKQQEAMCVLENVLHEWFSR